jgi:hypothetical protein
MKRPPNSPAPPTPLVAPRDSDRTPLALPQRAYYREIFEAFGIDGIVEMLAAGRTLTQVSAALGIPDGGALCTWLNQEHADLYALAQLRSAEMLMDEGQAKLEAAELLGAEITNPQVSLLKLQVDLLSKRAAQRNARYGVKAAPDDAQGGLPPRAAPTFQLIIAPGASATVEGRVIEGERTD